MASENFAQKASHRLQGMQDVQHVQRENGALYELAQKLSEKVLRLEEELLLVQEEHDVLREVLVEQVQALHGFITSSGRRD